MKFDHVDPPCADMWRESLHRRPKARATCLPLEPPQVPRKLGPVVHHAGDAVIWRWWWLRARRAESAELDVQALAVEAVDPGVRGQRAPHFSQARAAQVLANARSPRGRTAIPAVRVLPSPHSATWNGPGGPGVQGFVHAFDPASPDPARTRSVNRERQ